MAAIVYFEKILEEPERVTYRYGIEEEDFAHTVVISKANLRPIDVDPETAGVVVQVAFSGILKGYRRQGRWPERGAGYA